MKSTAPAPRAADDAQLLVEARRAVLRWYRRHRRDLPWRRTRDAYAIWISEIMLQQTRVDVVVPYYEAFLERFPDIHTLAQAPTEDVLRSWAGLGYYTRARNLQRAAQQIVERHGGIFPHRRDEVLALAGIGPYTAGAILSIAFGQRQPIVDGNVMRVLSRLFAMEQRIDTPTARRLLWSWAARWADCRAPGDANQGLMELGATLCARSSPRCADCPIVRRCGAAQSHRQEELPRRAARPGATAVDLVAFLVRRRGRLLLARRPARGLLQDFWEIPTHVHTEGNSVVTGDRQEAQRQFEVWTGVRVRSWRLVGEARHGILHHRIRVRILEAVDPRPATPTRRRQRHGKRHSVPGDTAAKPAATRLQNLSEDMTLRWATPAESRRLTLTTLTLKVLGAAAATDSTWQHHAGDRPAQQAAGRRRHEPA